MVTHADKWFFSRKLHSQSDKLNILLLHYIPKTKLEKLPHKWNRIDDIRRNEWLRMVARVSEEREIVGDLGWGTDYNKSFKMCTHFYDIEGGKNKGKR